MPIEAATYIHDLVPTNPLHTEGLAQSDSHLRLIKQVLQSTFPNLTVAVSASAADLGNGFVPVGGVVMWSGLVSAIPTNWHLCDGTTVGSVVCPDLRGKFVIGVDSHTGTYPEGSTGGAASQTAVTAADGAHTHTTDSQGTHNHGGATQGHALTIAEMPSHDHGLAGSTVLTASGGFSFNNSGGAVFGEVTTTALGGGALHTHPMSTDGAHTHTATSAGSTHTHSVTTPTLPPYYALAYIIRVT